MFFGTYPIANSYYFLLLEALLAYHLFIRAWSLQTLFSVLFSHFPIDINSPVIRVLLRKNLKFILLGMNLLVVPLVISRTSLRSKTLRLSRLLLLVATVAMLPGGLCGSIWIDNSYYQSSHCYYYRISTWGFEKWYSIPSVYDDFGDSSCSSNMKLLLPYTLVGLLSLLSVLFSISGILGPANRRIQLILGLLNTALITFILGLLLYLTFLQGNPYLPAGVSGSYNFHRHFFLGLALFSNLLAIYFIGRQEKPVNSA